jgi:hypothetical protein
VLTMDFIRAAAPLLIFLIIVSQMKLEFFSLMTLGGAMLAVLIVFKVLKTSDIAAIRIMLSGIVRQAPVRSTTIA